MAGGLLQSVLCVLGMVQQADGAGLGVVCDGGLKVAVYAKGRAQTLCSSRCFLLSASAVDVEKSKRRQARRAARRDASSGGRASSQRWGRLLWDGRADCSGTGALIVLGWGQAKLDCFRIPVGPRPWVVYFRTMTRRGSLARDVDVDVVVSVKFMAPSEVEPSLVLLRCSSRHGGALVGPSADS